MKTKKPFSKIIAWMLTLAMAAAMLPITAAAADTPTGTFDLAAGTWNGTTWDTYLADTIKISWNGTILTVNDGANITVTGVTDWRRIEVTGEASITLNDVSITGLENYQSPLLLKTGANLTLTIAGTNILTAGNSAAGIQAPLGTTLIINGAGSLTADGGASSAGIGGSNSGSSGGFDAATGGNITINGGTITANGGSSSAGIGGSRLGSGGNITITGGTITANGIGGGAGIGGGYMPTDIPANTAYGGTIKITGGTITANGGNNSGAGIGSGGGPTGGSGGDIEITGGTVTATGGGTGAGIGGGTGSTGGNIKISGGMVTASSNGNGAGIGGGAGRAGGNITIASGIVTATSNGTGAGIGGGSTGAGGNITISGGMVKASSNGNGAGIGGGIGATSGGTLTMDGNAVVYASSLVNNANGQTNTTGINNGILFNGNDGTVYGAVELQSNLTVTGTQTLTILPGASLTAAADVTLTNDGVIYNAGAIDVAVDGSGEEIVITTPVITTTTTPLPDGILDEAYSETLKATGNNVTWSISGGALPDGLELNAATGVISGTPTAAGNFDFGVTATNIAGSDGLVFSIYIVAPPTITTASLPNGTLGAAYSQTLAATGGTPITWSVDSGSLPNGLTLAANGTISGTPTAAGNFSFGVEATNVAGSDTKALSIAINSDNSNNGGSPSSGNGGTSSGGTGGGWFSAPAPEPEASEANTPSDWAKEAVEEAAKLGLIPEHLNGSWRRWLDRSEFAAFAVRLYELLDGKAITARGSFDDTTDVNVLKLAGLDIVSGDGTGKFYPEGSFSREMALTLMYNMLVRLGYYLPSAEPSFSDAESISPWARQAIGALQRAGIIQGDGGRFDPKDIFSREMGVVTVMNFLEYLK